MSNPILFSLGSNIGDRIKYINSAIELIKSRIKLLQPQLSSFYESEPVGFFEQDWYINVSLYGLTDLSVFKVHSICKDIEKELGRKERGKWHEREIDIDILLYGDLIINEEEIDIPHPRMHERRFVLLPSVEIAHNAIHPIFKKSITQLLDLCDDKSMVKKL